MRLFRPAVPSSPDDHELEYAISGSAKIDLHRHLSGSIRIETIYDLARKHTLPVPRPPILRRQLVLHEPVDGLGRYIRPRWGTIHQVVQDVDDVHRIAMEATIDAAADGVRYVEFRVSPPGLPLPNYLRQHREPFSDKAYLDAVQAGFTDAQSLCGTIARLILTVPRNFIGPMRRSDLCKYADALVSTAELYRDTLVVGIDLAGIEASFPASRFAPIFQAARAARIPVTIHAGETQGPEEVRSAIDELGAARIGHGVAIAKDPALLQKVIRCGVTVEICPTSNWLVGLFEPPHHPLLPLLSAGLDGVVCTDNPTICDTTLTREMFVVARALQADIRTFTTTQLMSARAAAFAPLQLLESALAAATPHDVGGGRSERQPGV